MKKIIKTFLTLIFIIYNGTVLAQPSNIKKAANSTFTLTTFKADGSILANSNGFFITTNGVCVSPWKPFIGASRAVVIDNKGQKHEVEAIMGANGIYDITKFKINASTTPINLTSNITSNSNAWIVTTSKSHSAEKATVKRVEKFMEKYNYSVLVTSANEQCNGALVTNDMGQAIGMYAFNNEMRSATDATFARDFNISGLSQNDLTLRDCFIRVALPTEQEEAIIALMLSTDKPEKYREGIVDEFLKKFPQLNDGYAAKANLLISKEEFEKADKVLREAIAKTTAKDVAHYNFARLQYQCVLNTTTSKTVKDLGWTLDEAMKEVLEANKIKPNPQYRHLQAKLIFAQRDYEKAYKAFEALTTSSIKNPELYLEMAQCKQQLNGDDNEILSLLNQSIELCDTPYVRTSAPYFFARAQQLDKMGQYRLAMKDYYAYEYFYRGQLGAEFYYMREQCEAKGKLWQQALQDILIASRLDPKEPIYCAEAGSLLLRVNKFEAAISAAKQAIELKPDYAEAYLILGIAQCQSNQKEEGIKNIQKAKELGNDQADSFLEKYK
ncbi:UNVERIFIED_CONTAM: serine protease [Prevotella sp. 15_C9]